MHNLLITALVLIIIIIVTSTTTTFVQAGGTVNPFTGLTATWSWTGTDITWTLTAPQATGTYMAVVVATDGSSGMGNGKGLYCAQPAVGASTTTCAALSTASYGTSSGSWTVTLVSASAASGGDATVVVKVAAADMNVAAGAKRTLFAKGSISGSTLSKHAAGGRAPATVTYAQDTTTAAATTSTTTSAAATTTTATTATTTSTTLAPGQTTTTAPPTTSTATTTAAPTTSTTTAATTTTTAAATTATTAATTTTTTVPSDGSVSALGGDINVKVTQDGDMLSWRLRSPLASGDKFFAVSVAASSSGMQGDAIVCQRPIDATTTNRCKPAQTMSSFSIQSRTDTSLTLVSASYASSTSEVVFNCSATALGITTTGSKRVLVAIGSWASAASLPSSHTNRGAITVSFVAPPTTMSTTLAPGVTPPPTTTSTAAPPTTSTSTTAVPQAKTNGTSYSTLGGNLKIDWVPLTTSSSSSSSTQNWTITLKSTDSKYSAVAFAASGMNGKGIACVVLSSGVPTCRIVQLTEYICTPQPKTNEVTILSSQRESSGAWQLTATMPTSMFSIVKSAGARRMIFARSTWQTSSDSPDPHDANTRAAASIDLFTGSASPAGGGHHHGGWRYPVAIMVGFVWAVASAFIGGALKSKHETSPSSVTIVLKILLIVSLIACLVGVIIGALQDCEAINGSFCAERGIGYGLTYLFSLLLLPVNKRLNITFAAGGSYERVIPFHIVCGISAFILILVHAIMMSNKFTSSGIITFADIVAPGSKYVTHMILPAVIGTALMGVMMITGFLRFLPGVYKVFKTIHLVLFPTVIICFALHAVVVLYALFPGLVLYAIDLFLTMSNENNADVVIAEVDTPSELTHIQLKLKDPVKSKKFFEEHRAGGWALLTISDVSMFPHPFTIASANAAAGTVDFFIKSAGPMTGALFNRAKEEKSSLTGAKLSAPMGHLPLDFTALAAQGSAVYLCVGGSGISVATGICDYFANVHASSSELQLFVVFCVREESLWQKIVRPAFERIIRVAEAAAVAGAAASGGLQINVTVHLTGSKKKQQQQQQQPQQDLELEELLLDPVGNAASSSSSSIPNITTTSGRPNWSQIFKDASSKFCKNGSPLIIHSCGPAPMMKSVAEAAGTVSALCSEEVFQI